MKNQITVHIDDIIADMQAHMARLTALANMARLASLFVLFMGVTSTVHAQGAPCNPYDDATCGGGGNAPFHNPYTPGQGGPIGGQGPYAGPNDPNPYNLAMPEGVTSAWTVNGDAHLDDEANTLGWLVIKNLDAYDQTVTIMFTFEDRGPLFYPVPVAATSRASVSLHDTTKFPMLASRYFSATAFFQRAGQMYATFARSCSVVNNRLKCVDSHDIPGVEVRMK